MMNVTANIGCAVDKRVDFIMQESQTRRTVWVEEGGDGGDLGIGKR